MWNRRSLLKLLAYGGAASALPTQVFAQLFRFFEPVDVENPLAYYPNRGWEKTYRDLWEYDSAFTFLCAPNDTHNCLLKAHVKNGVIVRLAPTYGYSRTVDPYGIAPSPRWEPRCCQKGLALVRRFYGDRRIRFPLIREGFYTWVQDGFPRDSATGAVPARYLEGRGKERFLKLTWEEAFRIAAQTLLDIARNYSGERGATFLQKQGYDPRMIAAMGEAGVQCLKFRGGMPALGTTRLFALYRLANAMALVDHHIRGVPPEKARGGRGWDNYSWHTDLPPGHPMVTGQQTVDWDLVCVEHTSHIVVWGMNWITTKMPDSHWLTEARLKGAKVTVIACEYSATASKGDYVLIVRPGTTPALALGFAHVILKENLYDPEYLKAYTDLPFLVRLDNGKLLRPEEIFPSYTPASLNNYIRILRKGETPPPPFLQDQPFVDEKTRESWGDFLIWDEKTQSPKVITRDDYGKRFQAKGYSPALRGTFLVKDREGRELEVTTVFQALEKYVLENFSPEAVEEITWAPREGIITLARELAKKPGETLFAMGMGPNQFFNNDLKDRAVFFLAALTRNIGRISGNVGSYAGNYRAAYLSGLPAYIAENPFAIELDPEKAPPIKPYFTPESVHYFNDGDRILATGKKVLTGESHIPAPTKAIVVANSNSLIGNAKGHFESVMNIFKRVEFIGVLDWWWTASCEYADLVFPVDSWAEFKTPDATISVTNPFLYIFPRTPLPRIFQTKGDMEVAAGIAAALADLLSEPRLRAIFHFVHEGKGEVYLQRVFSLSNATRGYRVEALEEQAKKGIPSLLLSRTYPKFVGYEQSYEDKPWYTRSGRLEFYRDEEEFLAAGENLPVYREPVDATFYEPNVIVSKPHPLIRPLPPEAIGLSPRDLEADSRQMRSVVQSWEAVKGTLHPLSRKDRRYRFIFHTPKYRHGAHTTPVDTDVVAIWFGPFGDIHRHDKRMPFITEMYLDINPLDARELGLEDGDYIYVDADPHDRPFRGWEQRPEEYQVARLLCRVRYYPGTPRGVTRMWHNVYTATFGSLEGARKNPTGLAKNPKTGYQSLFRSGSHQSCTRGWLKPTLMTDTLVRKELFGQKIGRGFAPDVHCPTGAPRESFVKLEFAEPGGYGGERLWKPAARGMRPTYEDPLLRTFMSGGFVEIVS